MFVDANGYALFGYVLLAKHQKYWLILPEIRGVATKQVEDNTTSSLSSTQLHSWPYNDSEKLNPVEYFFDQPASPPVSSNVCCGCSTSIPNGHKSFYFSGLTSSTQGILEYSPSNDSRQVSLLSRDFTTCDTTDLSNINCTSVLPPDFVKPRTEAALVWLPLGQQGLIILFSGIERPADVLTEAVDPNKNGSSFMTDILIYDIAMESWHLQSILGTGQVPTATASFCTTLASSKDHSLFNIYMYGGYDGTYTNANVYDDVWVLSLPSSTWIKVYVAPASSSHGRQWHQCVSPYSNLRMTIWGSGSYGMYLGSPTAIDVFDMNELIWTSYDPLDWSDYKVPQVISNVTGGNKNGGAKLPSTGLDPAVAALFKTPYKGKIPIYYPYAKKTLLQHIRVAFSCLLILWRRRYLKAVGLSGADLGPGHGSIVWLQGLLGRKIELPLDSNTRDKIKPLTIPYFDDVDTVSTKTRVSIDGNSTGASRWSEQNSLFDEVELRTFINTGRAH